MRRNRIGRNLAINSPRSLLGCLFLLILLAIGAGCQSPEVSIPTLVPTAVPPIIAERSGEEAKIMEDGNRIGSSQQAQELGQQGKDAQAQIAQEGLPEGEVPGQDLPGQNLPVTWTPVPQLTPPTPTRPVLVSPSPPTATPLPIPTRTPVPPSPTPTPTVTPFTPTPTATDGVEVRPLEEYALEDVIPLEAFPRPEGDNGWGIHWIPTVKQDPGVVDHFVNEVMKMHIRWVVFLNDGSNIGDNDYLVERLVDAGIMPVMRIFRSNVLPYDGNVRKMVEHYRAKGVYYYQLYNEPNANEENSQGFANANVYALTWASAARDVIEGGGFPGLGALSPGGAFDHYTFLDRTIQALKRNGDIWLLNRSWLSVHNYQGLRSLDDEGGFLLFRNYDKIIQDQIGRSMPMIGTEGGSYSANILVEKDYITFQYTYMRQAEPYFFAFSHWLLANEVGGSWDDRWEYQALFREGFVHPVVTEFFYRTRE